MNLPVTFPDWVPPWVPLALLVPCLLFALAFLFMPFSVIGLKGRLDAIEARLDEIQGEIRSLSLRIPERAARAHFDELYTAPPPPPEPIPEIAPEPSYVRPPIPPATRYFEEPHPPLRADTQPPYRSTSEYRREPPPRRAVRTDRNEPHLNWPP